MTLQRDLGLNNCGGWNESCFEAMIAVGFRYVYLDQPSWNDAAKLRAAYDLVERYRSAIVPFSIHLPMLVRSWDFNSESVAREYAQLIEKSAPFGVARATLHLRTSAFPNWSGPPPQGDLDEYESRVAALLARCCQVAAQHHITLGLENDLWDERAGMWLATAEDLMRMVKRVGEANVGICLDSNHAAASGLNPAQMIRDMGDHLVETHFNDTFGYFQGRTILECDMHLPPGIGRINWVEVLDALDAIQYPYPIIFELTNNTLMSEGWPPEQQKAHPYHVTFEDLARICYTNWRAVELARWAWDNVKKGSRLKLGQRQGYATSPHSSPKQ